MFKINFAVFFFITDDGRPFRGDEQSVFEDIMRNYNKHMRPVRNDKEMVVVDFTIKLKQIVDIVSILFFTFYFFSPFSYFTVIL